MPARMVRSPRQPHVAYDSLDHLRPIFLEVPLELVVSAEVSIQLGAGDEFKQIGVKAHLVARNGVEERLDALIEEREEERKVYDDRTAERFNIVMLEDS